eukprot:scaffold51584_cov69-Phaeocystis_antarctica.AAC.4
MSQAACERTLRFSTVGKERAAVSVSSSVGRGLRAHAGPRTGGKVELHFDDEALEPHRLQHVARRQQPAVLGAHRRVLSQQRRVCLAERRVVSQHQRAAKHVLQVAAQRVAHLRPLGFERGCAIAALMACLGRALGEGLHPHGVVLAVRREKRVHLRVEAGADRQVLGQQVHERRDLLVPLQRGLHPEPAAIAGVDVHRLHRVLTTRDHTRRRLQHRAHLR